MTDSPASLTAAGVGNLSLTPAPTCMPPSHRVIPVFKLIRKKLGSKNPKVVLLALTVSPPWTT